MMSYNNVQGKYNFASKEKKPISLSTIILALLAVIFFCVFVFSLQAEGHQKFCTGLGYNYVAYIRPNKVCIKESMAYIEISCSGVINPICEVLGDEKEFKRNPDDFSDYKIKGDLNG